MTLDGAGRRDGADPRGWSGAARARERRDLVRALGDEISAPR
jgi:hypothetical protein